MEKIKNDEQLNIPVEEEISATESFEEENVEEETNELLASYQWNYNDEERKTFFELNNPPMWKQSNVIFSIVCFAIAILVFFLRSTYAVSLALLVLGIIWSGIPALIYLMRYARYKRKAKTVWGYSYQMDIYEAYAEMTRISNPNTESQHNTESPENTENVSEQPTELSDNPSEFSEAVIEKEENSPEHKIFSYDDFYKIIRTDLHLYLIAGQRNIFIVPRKHVTKDVWNALLDLDIPKQEGKRY